MLDYVLAILLLFVSILGVCALPLFLITRHYDKKIDRNTNEEVDEEMREFSREKARLKHELKYVPYICENCGAKVRLLDGTCNKCGTELQEVQLIRYMLREKRFNSYD